MAILDMFAALFIVVVCCVKKQLLGVIFEQIERSEELVDVD